jgi:hypothetical protein
MEHGKGYAKGITHHNAKLTPETIAEAQRLRRSGMAWSVIAEQFGVNKTTISRAARGEVWRHLDAPDDLPDRKRIDPTIVAEAKRLRAGRTSWLEVEMLTGYSRKGLLKYWSDPN